MVTHRDDGDESRWQWPKTNSSSATGFIASANYVVWASALFGVTLETTIKS